MKKCDECNGEGKEFFGIGGVGIYGQMDCPKCGGSGEIPSERDFCPDCQGTKEVFHGIGAVGMLRPCKRCS